MFKKSISVFLAMFLLVGSISGVNVFAMSTVTDAVPNAIFGPVASGGDFSSTNKAGASIPYTTSGGTKYLYVTTNNGNLGTTSTTNGLKIYNVSTATAITNVTPSSSTNSSIYFNAGDNNAAIDIVGTDLYILDNYNKKLKKFSIVNPENPSLTASYTISVGGIVGFKIKGTMAYAFGNGSIVAIDITAADGTASTAKLNAPDNGNYTTIAVDGNYIYAGDNLTGKINVFKIGADPKTISLVATRTITTYATNGRTDAIANFSEFTIIGRYLYTAMYSQIIPSWVELVGALDISQPEAIANADYAEYGHDPSALFKMGRPSSMKTDGRYLYVADMANNVSILDTYNPLSLQPVGHAYRSTYGFYSLSISSDRIYALGKENGISVYTYANSEDASNRYEFEYSDYKTTTKHEMEASTVTNGTVVTSSPSIANYSGTGYINGVSNTTTVTFNVNSSYALSRPFDIRYYYNAANTNNVKVTLQSGALTPQTATLAGNGAGTTYWKTATSSAVALSAGSNTITLTFTVTGDATNFALDYVTMSNTLDTSVTGYSDNGALKAFDIGQTATFNVYSSVPGTRAFSVGYCFYTVPTNKASFGISVNGTNQTLDLPGNNGGTFVTASTTVTLKQGMNTIAISPTFFTPTISLDNLRTDYIAIGKSVTNQSFLSGDFAFGDLVLKNTDGTVISSGLPTSGQTVYAGINALKQTSSAVSYSPTMILACFNGDKLISAFSTSKTVSSYAQKDVLDLSFVMPSNTTSIKAFTWDSISAMKPLTLAKTK